MVAVAVAVATEDVVAVVAEVAVAVGSFDTFLTYMLLMLTLYVKAGAVAIRHLWDVPAGERLHALIHATLDSGMANHCIFIAGAQYVTGIAIVERRMKTRA